MIQLRRRSTVEPSENTDFVRDMKAALAKRLAATTEAGKRDAQREMDSVMLRYARKQRELLTAAQASADVCTQDRKLAAAGRD